MLRTRSNIIRGLSKNRYKVLKELCRYSNNLYNVAMYNVRQNYFENGTFLGYSENYHLCKDNENYKMLQASISQKAVKCVERDFRIYFSLLKKSKEGDYRFNSISMPRYKSKGGMFPIVIFGKWAIRQDKGYVKVPLSYNYMCSVFNGDIIIKMPEDLKTKNIKEVRIVPFQNGRYFKIQYVYEQEVEDKNLNKENAIAIDLGVDNLATCVPTNGTPFIIDGRKLKSINQYWNKQRAKYLSIAKKVNNQNMTKHVQDLDRKRNNRVNDYMKKSARYILNYCIQHDIGTIVIGYNKGFKQNVGLGKVNNQKFYNIPLLKLKEQLKNLCERYGMQYIEVEESYTSKSSFIDNDPLPEYKPEQSYTGSFSGKRIYRGLYQSKNGTLVNADVNGAANILRKSKQNFDFKELCKGITVSPNRVKSI